MDYSVIKSDVLVIGAGGAGLRAAIEAHDTGMQVVLVGKSLRGKAHTVMAEGGINAPLGNIDPKDNWKVYFADTLKEGQFIGDYRLIEILAKEASNAILELENYGALFDRTPEGKIMQRPFGAHKHIRTCHIGDRTGLEIMTVLVDQTVKRKIQNFSEIFVTTLLKNKNGICGAVGIDIKTGKLLVFHCKAVILATGGCARVYKRTTNPWENVGDGHAMAYQAGAELQDMEMVQFHPTGMVYPPTAEGILVTESVRGEGGILLNSKDERFMKKYDSKRMELSARDIVSRAIFMEIHAGKGTKHGGVWLDITHKPRSYIMKKLPKMYKQFMDFADLDITKERMEVAPSAHYTMGGIRASPNYETSVKGLYSVGEVSGGLHGANRLGGNSLTELLVFGKIIGKKAGIFSKKVNRFPLNKKDIELEWRRITAPFKRKGMKPQKIKKEIAELMWEYVGIFRNEKSLLEALKKIKEIISSLETISVKGSLKYNPEWMDYMDLTNMVVSCEAIIRSALFRKESRGAHHRVDFPKQDDKHWKVDIIAKKGKNGMIIFREKVPEMNMALKKEIGDILERD